MSDKKNPQPFNSSLFSSPAGGSGSGGLSLGFDEPFSSPFALAPALSSTSASSKPPDDGRDFLSSFFALAKHRFANWATLFPT